MLRTAYSTKCTIAPVFVVCDNSSMKAPPAPEAKPRKTVTLPAVMWGAVEAYRHDNRIKSEAKAIERLIQLGLDAEGKRMAREAGRRG